MSFYNEWEKQHLVSRRAPPEKLVWNIFVHFYTCVAELILDPITLTFPMRVKLTSV